MKDSLHLLVVDDEPDTLGLLELTLQTAGYRVHTAMSGDQALALIRQNAFDLIVLDIMMPGITGFDLYRQLQQELPDPPPVVFLTAKNRPEDRAEGERLGARHYLVKPTTRGQLLDAIRLALGETSGPRADG